MYRTITVTRPTTMILVLAAAFAFTAACSSGGTAENPEQMSVKEAYVKAKDGGTGWVRVTGRVATTGFSDSRTRHGWICPEDAGSGFSIQRTCVTCGDSDIKESLAARDGDTATLSGRIFVNGVGEVALQECRLQ